MSVMPITRLACLVAVAAALTMAGAAHAADSGPAEGQPICKRAEVNPITGHVFCVEPPNGYVEPLPEDATSDCDQERPNDEGWAYGTKCNQDGGGGS